LKLETTSDTPSAVYSSDNGSIDTTTLELLASWRLQDATNNPDEVRAAEQELAEFKKTMNETCMLAGEPLVYP
jgi:hypothetical protein